MSKAEYAGLVEHPIAKLFPMMATDTEEWREFVDDIRVHGLRTPITLYEGKILDGRNRYRACLESSTMIEVEEYVGRHDEAVDLVLSLNLHRRHLTIGQLALVAAEVANMKRGRPSNNVSADTLTASLAKASRQVGVSRRSAARARAVKDSGNGEALAGLKSGRLSVSGAYRQATGKEVHPSSSRDYEKEHQKRKDFKRTLALVQDVPPARPRAVNGKREPLSITRFLERSLRIVGNIIRNPKYLGAIVAEREALPDDVRQRTIQILRNFAKELLDYAERLTRPEDDHI